MTFKQNGGNQLVLSAPANRITLHRRGQYTHVIPPVEGLEGTFYSVRHKAADLGDEHPAVVPIIEPLMWTNEDSQGKTDMQCFAGLESLVVELLKQSGFDIALAGKRPAPLSAPDVERLGCVNPIDPDVLSFVRNKERGVIRFDRAGHVHPARLVAQVALAWPKLRIVVIATRIDDACAVVEQLAKLGVDATLLTGCHTSSRIKRVVVGTYAQLAQAGVRLRKRHICFAMNPTELFDTVANTALAVIKDLAIARLYGFLPTDMTMPVRSRDLVLGIFGPEQVIVPKHGWRPLPIEVAFTPVHGGHRPPHRAKYDVVKRVGVHEHRVRNRRIVRLAQVLNKQCKKNEIAQEFPGVEKVVAGRQPVHVGVLVDNIDHGLHLAALLDWPLVVGDHINEQGLTADQQALLQRGRTQDARTLEPVVMTGEGMQIAGRFGVIIRADGGTGLPCFHRVFHGHA